MSNGRFKPGEAHPNAVLNDNDVRLMRALYDDGIKISDIAEKWEVPYETARNVCRRRLWKHVD